MSRKYISSKKDLQVRLRSIRKDLQSAQDILARENQVVLPLPIVPIEKASTEKFNAPGLLEDMKDMKEDLSEIQDRLNRGEKRLLYCPPIEEHDDRLSSAYGPRTRPINNYLWWFSVKVWFQAELPVPVQSEDPVLNESMLQCLLKASHEVCLEVFKTENALREARKATIDTPAYKNLTATQILIILEKFTKVMLVQKKHQQALIGETTETTDEAGQGPSGVPIMTTSVYV